MDVVSNKLFQAQLRIARQNLAAQQASLNTVRAYTPYFDFDTNTLGHWLFNEGQGSTVRDKANAINATITGGTWGSDEHGTYLAFDGATTSVDAGTSQGYHPASANICTWDAIVMPLGLSPSNNSPIFNKAPSSWSGGANDTVRIDINSAGIRFRGAGATTTWDVTASSVLQVGQLVHVRCVYDETHGSEKQRIYVNDMSTAAATANTSAGTLNNTAVGSSIFGMGAGGLNFVNARLYEFRISDIVREGQLPGFV